MPTFLNILHIHKTTSSPSSIVKWRSEDAKFQYLYLLIAVWLFYQSTNWKFLVTSVSASSKIATAFSLSYKYHLYFENLNYEIVRSLLQVSHLFCRTSPTFFLRFSATDNNLTSTHIPHVYFISCFPSSSVTLSSTALECFRFPLAPLQFAFWLFFHASSLSSEAGGLSK